MYSIFELKPGKLYYEDNGVFKRNLYDNDSIAISVTGEASQNIGISDPPWMFIAITVHDTKNDLVFFSILYKGMICYTYTTTKYTNFFEFNDATISHYIHYTTNTIETL